MNHKVSILSTASLDQALLDKASGQGVELDTIPFINVEPVTDKDVLDEVNEFCSLPITAVFTSANAVRAIADIILNAQPEWNVYCVGNTTRNAVLEYFDNALISGIADDAATLASIIKDHDVLEVVFFCGNKRMDLLPELLSLDDIAVHEVIVYHTTETPHVATKGYDAILFFSPSGVNSFFSVNAIAERTVLFAIGNTTANAVKQKTSNEVIVSETPSKEQLLADAIEYFHNLPRVAGPENNKMTQ